MKKMQEVQDKLENELSLGHGDESSNTDENEDKSSCASTADDSEKKNTKSHNGKMMHEQEWIKQKYENFKKRKINDILQAVKSDPVDIISLRQLAISKDGLICDKARKHAWPKLLNVNVFDISPKPPDDVLKAHKYFDQVVLDVNRSLKRFPPGMEEDLRGSLQDQMVDIIMRILVEHNDLHYYQGYHDIVVTFLLVVGEDVSYAMVEKLSVNHLRDFMDPDMKRTSTMLNYLYPIIGRASPKLRVYMEKAELGTIFCLSWLITWYGHVLNDFRHTVRLYDLFLACHPLMPIYFAAAIVLHREADVLATECDMAMIHCLLSKIPSDLPVELLVSKAGDLFVQYPPHELAEEAEEQFRLSTSISNYTEFEMSTLNQRPDSILKKQPPAPRPKITYSTGYPAPEKPKRKSNYRYSAYAVVIGITATGVAAMNTLLGWDWMW